jgi:hypothetical protein
MGDKKYERGIVIIGSGDIGSKTAIAASKHFPDENIVIIEDAPTHKIIPPKQLPELPEIVELRDFNNYKDGRASRRERRKQQRKRR